MLLKEIWVTGKLAFKVYKEILFDGGPIIRFKSGRSTLVLLGLCSLYLTFWGN